MFGCSHYLMGPCQDKAATQGTPSHDHIRRSMRWFGAGPAASPPDRAFDKLVKRQDDVHGRRAEQVQVASPLAKVAQANTPTRPPGNALHMCQSRLRQLERL
ncbi:hypothetical protein E4U55_006643 [Claviceps digitariae]|nr:hypothetical protein E4U55_006643 [Claviceps digitariae]